MCAMLSFNDASIACYQAEMFPTEVRRTGVEYRLRGVRLDIVWRDDRIFAIDRAHGAATRFAACGGTGIRCLVPAKRLREAPVLRGRVGS